MLLAITSCNANAQKKKSTKEDTKTLMFSFSAGRGGKVEIKATKDSIVTKSWGMLSEKYPKGSKKMNAADWKEITSILKYDDFLKLENGEERGLYDGPDDVLTMTSTNNEKEHKVINAKNSVYTQSLEKLKNKLKTLVEK